MRSSDEKASIRVSEPLLCTAKFPPTCLSDEKALKVARFVPFMVKFPVIVSTWSSAKCAFVRSVPVLPSLIVRLPSIRLAVRMAGVISSRELRVTSSVMAFDALRCVIG